MPKKKQMVWVFMHYEYMGAGSSERIDSVQFHVSSSRRKAEKFVREMWVQPFSWWQVHPYVVDADDWLSEGEEVYYYSHKGAPLRRPPYKRALRAWERDKVKNPDMH
jgi:hypothetical protein